MPCYNKPSVLNKTCDAIIVNCNTGSSEWRRPSGEMIKNGGMSGPFSSFVLETIYNLCKRNEELNRIGVTYSQLKTVLSLKLSRGTSPAFITELIGREIDSKTILLNHLGNYIMNPNPPCSENVCLDESSSDSSHGTKETNSITTERTVDSSDVDFSQKSEENAPTVNNVKKPDFDQLKSAHEITEKMEICEAASEPIVKPVKHKKRGRRVKKSEVIIIDKEELFTPEQSPSPDRDGKRSDRSIILSSNSGRRIIRKKTKYDPSEFYLTPLIRKRKGVGCIVEEPKVKLKRGRPSHKAKLEAAAAAAAAAAASKKLVQMKHIKVDPPTDGKGTNKAASPVKSPPDASKFKLFEKKEETVKSKGSMLKSQCYICCDFAEVNNSDETFACSLCLNIAHKDCIVEDDFYKQLKKWRCSECLMDNPIACSVCDKEYKNSDGVMLTCDFCEEFYHSHCHSPPVKLPLSDSPWFCSVCPRLVLTDSLIGGREDLKSSVGTFAFCASSVKCESIPKPVNLPESDPLSSNETVPELEIIKEEPIEEEEEKVSLFKYHRPEDPIPTVDDWTPKQVADYFSERFGCVVGNAFLSQEIDGKSLKLMSRIDVIDRLGLHFGIALKVLYYVRKIQLNTNIIQELWT